jgi:hypothetical protein
MESADIAVTVMGWALIAIGCGWAAWRVLSWLADKATSGVDWITRHEVQD